MFVRLALESDREALRTLGKAHAAETWPDRTWSDERAERTLQRYLNNANPTIYVVEDKRLVVGYCICLIVECSFTTSNSAFLDVIYVKPVKRGTRAAVLLMQAFEAWASREAPDEVLLQALEAESPAQLPRFFRRFGFHPAGMLYKLCPQVRNEVSKR